MEIDSAPANLFINIMHIVLSKISLKKGLVPRLIFFSMASTLPSTSQYESDPR